jgi:hypothetical protein
MAKWKQWPGGNKCRVNGEQANGNKCRVNGATARGETLNVDRERERKRHTKTRAIGSIARDFYLVFLSDRERDRGAQDV